MNRAFVIIDASILLEQVYKKLSSEQKTVAVEKFLGIISLDGINRYFMIETAMKRPEP